MSDTPRTNACQTELEQMFDGPIHQGTAASHFRLLAGELEEELSMAVRLNTALREEVAELRNRIKVWEAYKRNIDEALNSGDGAYRP